MKLTLAKDGYEFDFPSALSLFKFDEDDKTSPNYHGLSHCMKAVDVIAEFEKFQLWIEIKKFSDEDLDAFKDNFDGKAKGKRKTLNDYLNDVKVKFRDTYLYRRCEDKIDKPIFYVFLTNLHDDQCLQCKTIIEQNIPTKRTPTRWVNKLLESEFLQVVNINVWDNQFHKIIGKCTQI